MPTETLSAPLGSPRLAGASKGVACSTTAARTVLPFGTRLLSMVTRNYSTAVVIGFNLNPWLTVLKTTDGLATQTNLTDYSLECQDGSTSTSAVFSSLGTAAQGDYIFIGSHEPFSGFNVDIDAANGTASVMTVEYWNGSAWADTSATDGTDSGGATLAVDGSVTFTVPAAWATARLKDTMTGEAPNVGVLTHEKYWLRISVSAALDSSTTADHVLSINASTAYAELIPGQVWEQAIVVGEGGYSSVTSITDAGTANLIINCAPRHGGRIL